MKKFLIQKFAIPFLPEAFQLPAFLVSSTVICGHTWWLIQYSQFLFGRVSQRFVVVVVVVVFFCFVALNMFFPDISPESLCLINNSRHVVLWSQRNVSSLVSVEFLCVFSVSFVLVEIKNYRHFSNLLKRWAQACGCCLSFPTVAGIWFSCFILCLLIGAFFRFSLNGFSF